MPVSKLLSDPLLADVAPPVGAAPATRATRALVWFKRDLRVHDHAPLVAALGHADALALFVIEPEWLQSPECDASHVDFALACLAELRAALAGPRAGRRAWMRRCTC